MLESDEEKRKQTTWKDENGGEDGDSGSGQGALGGQGGALAFRDFVFVEEERKLSPEQEKQHLAVHKETHGALIEKQKQLFDERKNKKEGKTATNQYGNQYGMGTGNSSYLKHPILGKSPEFDGIDPKVNLDPTIYDADTNAAKKDELTYQHQLRLGLENQPRFNPKPSPF